jgi:type II secretory pathway component GspD/PulD (secretin)
MLTILLTLSCWGTIAEAAQEAGSAPQARPALPSGVKAGDYVRAVVKLYSGGRSAEAGPYISAARLYRDLLTPDEAATLDRYSALVAQASAPATAAPSYPSPSAPAFAPRDRAVALVSSARQALTTGQVEEARRLAHEAQSLSVPFAADEDNPARVLADADRAANGPLARASTGSLKQQAGWLLKSAREQMRLGNFDAAAQIIAQAKAMDVRWTLFDDTPAKVEADLQKIRPQISAAAPAAGDRTQAKTRLKEARTSLNQGDYDRAEAIALEVGSWGLNYGILEDNPSKIVSAARALRRREASRQGGSKVQQSESVYNTIVAEARQLMTTGQYEAAEARARQAQQMNVVPSLTADRAEAVLHDIAMIRARVSAPQIDPAVSTVRYDSPSSEAERQANELLAQNQLDAARAKFVEAERLRQQEAGIAADEAPVALVDPAGDPTTPSAPTPAISDPFHPAQPPAAPADLAPAPIDMTSLTNAGAPPSANLADAMAQAHALLAAGNYRAARQAAEAAKAAGGGLEADNLIAQIAQTQQQAVLSLYEAALDGLRKGDYARSRALLTELSTTDLDEATHQKVQDLLAQLPAAGGPTGDDRLKAIQDAETVKAQQMNAEVGTKVAEARRLLETDPAQAIALLEKQKLAVQQAGLSEAVSRTMLRRLDVAVELARKDKVVFDEKMKDKAFREEIEHKRLRMIEFDKVKKAKFKEYMDKAQEAQARSDWLEAEKYAKLAAEIDPNEISATALATVARIQRHYKRDLQLRDEANEGFATAMQDVSQAGIVSPELMSRNIKFEDGFAALTASRRELADRLSIKKPAKTVEIEKILNKPVTLPNSDQMTLGEAIKYLSEYTGLNIVPDSGALAEEGLTLNTPVNLTAVNNIKLKSVLKYMLAPLHLNYVIDEEVLLITSPQTNKSRMYPVVYSVADLVVSPLAKKGIDSGLNYIPPPGVGAGDPATLQAQAAAMSGAPGLGVAPSPGSAVSTSGGTTTATGERKIEFDPLIRLIKSSIAPGTWSDNHTSFEESMNGFGQGFADDAVEEGVGSIMPFFLNISLIIRQTSEVHEEIVDLLRQLRRLQDLQVSIEVRFITVSDDFYELIGVDFDMNLQSDVVGRKSSFAIPNPAAVPGTTGGGTAGTAVAPYLINPIRDHAYGREPLVVGTNGPTNDVTTPSFAPNLGIPFQQNTIDAITPFNSVANVTANMGVAFLSDLEVFFFMTAIQGDQRANVVQAPKVTSFNGAPASVINVRAQNYVAQLTPVLGAGAVAFQPQIQTFPDGVQLFVTPVVSADRRYVRMSLNPIFTVLEGFDNFVIPAAVGGGGLGGQSSTINAQVQLPVFTVTTISTTVTVPDGGTVLLGGVKRLQEERNEFGVPILSKTPMIDRLFRNVGIGRRTTSLMVMVTPRIIILEEEEERLGIPAIENVTF